MLHPWICLVLVMMTASAVYASSLAHTVFLPANRSINPFDDLFIQRIVNMDRQQLHAIPQMEDHQFLLRLQLGDDTLGGGLSRSNDDDAYESVFDDKLDDQLTLQDNIDREWTHLMTAGPLTVNYVSNLLVIASKRDFPLSYPPNFVFHYIKDPTSFRATLAQVSNSMYSALIAAHTAMDRIQLNVRKIPDHVKTVLKIAIAGSPNLIKLMLSNPLESIGRIANESAMHARSTFEKFSALQELITEVIEANTNTNSGQQNIVTQLHAQIDKGKQEQEQLNDNLKSIKAQYESARQEVEKARREYQEAYNAIPVARKWFKKAFQRIIGTATSVVSKTVRRLPCVLGFCSSITVDARQAVEAAAAADIAAASAQALAAAAQATAQAAAATEASAAATQALAKAMAQAAVATEAAAAAQIVAAAATAAATAETAKQNAIAKANLHLQALRDAEKRLSSFSDQAVSEQQNLVVTMNKISNLALDKMTAEEIIDILINSTRQMNIIKEQWGRLIQFFSKVSAQADMTQKVIVHEFISVLTIDGILATQVDPSDREIFIEILTITSQEIEREAHLLYIMSKTYYDVSSQYMINQIAGVNTLLLLQTDNERSSYLRSIAANITSTSIRVTQLTEERQLQYTSRNKVRREQYDQFLLKLALEDLEANIG